MEENKQLSEEARRERERVGNLTPMTMMYKHFEDTWKDGIGNIKAKEKLLNYLLL